MYQVISNLKSKVDKLVVGKLETTPVGLSKLSNVVKNDFVKKTDYNELIKKVNTIQTTDISNLVKKPTLTHRLTKLKRKLLIMIIVISILLHKSLIRKRQKILLQD